MSDKTEKYSFIVVKYPQKDNGRRSVEGSAEHGQREDGQAA